MREISRGGVMRAVALPAGLEADTAEASFENGLRRLRIPKAAKLKPRQICILTVSADETARG